MEKEFIDKSKKDLKGEREQMAVNLAHCLNMQKKGQNALTVSGYVPTQCICSSVSVLSLCVCVCPSPSFTLPLPLVSLSIFLSFSLSPAPSSPVSASYDYKGRLTRWVLSLLFCCHCPISIANTTFFFWLLAVFPSRYLFLYSFRFMSSLHLEPICGEHQEKDTIERFDPQPASGDSVAVVKEKGDSERHFYHGAEVSFFEVGILQTTAAILLLVALRFFTARSPRDREEGGERERDAVIRLRGRGGGSSGKEKERERDIEKDSSLNGAGRSRSERTSRDFRPRLLDAKALSSPKGFNAKRNYLLSLLFVVVIMALLAYEAYVVENEESTDEKEIEGRAEEGEEAKEMLKSYATTIMALVSGLISYYASKVVPTEK